MSDQKNYNYNPVATMDNISNPNAADVSGLPSTHSSQQLMQTDTESVITQSNERLRAGFSSVLKKEWLTVSVLCFVNLINYMDRFTIAGVLTDIQDDLKIRDDEGGLLQTAFVISYMLFAPIFGYLGDRYSRRLIMCFGVLIWSGTTLLGSFMSNYYLFLTFRAFVGIGEASYSTIAPTIISDLFVSDLRSKMLALFYFAIPVGSGLGYIVGSETAALFGNWRWALRVTPILGAIAVVLLYFIHEPARGEAEGSQNLSSTTYKEDLRYLFKNRSFMLSTCGFTCVAFVTGALAWWGPKFIYLGLRMQPGNEHITLNEVSFTFGALTMTAGIIGVPLGSYLSQHLNKKYPSADPLLCASGLLISVPLLAGSMIVVSKNTIATYILCFVGQIALNINWAIVADILLYVVVPTRRSTAEAFQILISHAFGDAGSPYLVGVISEAIKHSLRVATTTTTLVGAAALQSLSLTIQKTNETFDTTNSTQILSDVFIDDDSDKIKFQGLQYALFSTSFVEVLGGVFFLITAVYIVRDKTRASKAVLESQNESSSDDSTLSVSSIDLTLHPRV